MFYQLGLARESHAQSSIPDEDFWHAVWPNTSIPSALRELLKHGREGVEIDNLPMQIDDTQYPKTFFYEQDLHPGKTMNVQFSKSPFTQPFTILTWLKGLKIKDIDKEGYTFDELCIKTKPNGAEHKFCAKSLETLIGFAISKLGKNIQVLSSSFVNKQELYKVEGVQNLGDKAVMCHRLNFRTVAFYCHEVRGTTAFMVPLVAGDGTKTQALAVCHSDTSGMNRHILHQTMGVDPGTNTVCHFLGSKAILWVPNLAMDTAYQTNIVV
ncbi:hypothetical protein AAZX31_13G267000 [Glycine max]|uniref:BURP domain-containing protein n=1 Tax=Glycine max TaxID=3847 RepID=I1M3F5_SOYBN|nr:unknown seed protein USP isoform X2 [Glycine max]XP_028190524.1 unknown seed protein USP-like isoform X2 [Glycine soja]KAG4971871.1 hypothetical protein JHK85_038292 [Glycine max]KAG4978267.1 hypothetical protein JHK86_037741 [Glycine max]KAG5131556.1 hypothetical protein JHK84_037953 [Glycine max]KAH1103844.1 hypothetical protein GYH30_037653 [Glycine max]KRH22186.1 hypothetical protein GLYMA_13G283900v4 [Glycine max]|eukprot:XP_014621424.1 unknown seed protein USP isoform X2 [Glycine max]